ncbi:hypothetical protein KVT40_005476 [Elsinoe batatas]|uniref:hydroxymethylglutaryl-CoA lyase n=1 Tax=Elsinoe batatas TaxID=2601811 RepID=A0A8K0KYJ9_9PEZI|nr:hypothetical protein KVT40_005476 [Elsinoe batatas]
MKAAIPRVLPRTLSPRLRTLQCQRRCLSTPRPTPDFVRVIDVGPRDGLQNEKKSISVETKLELIRRLASAGLQTIEAGSFVSPKWTPQMAASDDIMKSILESPPSSSSAVTYQWLLPNMRGLETFNSIYLPSQANSQPAPPNDHGPSLNTSSADPNAMPSNPSPTSPQSQPPAPSHEISIFLAATESFSRKNTNCSIAESLERFAPLMASARDNSVPVRAYISVALGCPFEGPDVSRAKVAELAATLLEMGADEIAVADTTGMGTAPRTRELLRTLEKAGIRPGDLALHFHDTFGQSLTNVLVGLEHGVRTFDGAVGGLGGCPYSPGATGNISTEDLVYTLHSLGAETGVDLEELSRVGEWITGEVGKVNESRAGKGTLGRLRAN